MRAWRAWYLLGPPVGTNNVAYADHRAFRGSGIVACVGQRLPPGPTQENPGPLASEELPR